MYYVDALPKAISIGKQGEGEVTSIQFDVSAWINDYPGLPISISMTDPRDSERQSPYLVSGVTLSNGILTWLVGKDATQYDGLGTIVIRCADGDVDKRSACTRVIIDIGHGAAGDTPEPMADWLAEADALRQAVAEGAAAAAGSAGTASTKAGEAASSAQAASTSAGQATTAKQAAEAARDTAVTKAGEAAGSAQQAAQSAAVYDALAGRVDGHDTQLADIRQTYKVDFLESTSLAPWVAAVINGGTLPGLTSSAKHPGLVAIRSHASNTDSGYYVTAGSGLVLSGSEKTTIVFSTPPTLAGRLSRLGYHNTSTSAVPTDGVYVKIDGATLTGQTSNNGVSSTTTTNFTLSSSAYYRLSIELNTDASLATFTLFADDSSTVLWADTINTNIPKARSVPHRVSATVAAPSGATDGIYLDYMDTSFAGARRVS